MKKLIYLSILTFLLYGCSNSTPNSASGNNQNSVFGVYQRGDGVNQSRIYLYQDSTYFELKPTLDMTQTEFDGVKVEQEYIYSDDKIGKSGTYKLTDRGDFYVIRLNYEDPSYGLYWAYKLQKDFTSFYLTHEAGLGGGKSTWTRISGEDGLINR